MIDVTRTETTTLRKASPGDFVSFRYRDSDGEHSERNVLVLVYEEDRELLHGLDLDNFSDQNLARTGRELAQLAGETEAYDERFVEDGDVILETVSDSDVEQWYELSYSADQYEDNPYRTFRKEGIRNLRKVDVSVVTET